MSNHSFVGCVNRSLALLQHSTQLYLVNVPKVSEELFYQLLLRDFGNLGALRLNPPAPIRELALIALDSKEAGWTEADGKKEDLADYVCKCLVDRADMLDDYFSMEISDDPPSIRTLPMLAGKEDFVPRLEDMPLFVLRLATEVAWHEEEACFHTFLKYVHVECIIIHKHSCPFFSCLFSNNRIKCIFLRHFLSRPQESEGVCKTS